MTPVFIKSTPENIVRACVRLAERAGATSWELGWSCPHLPLDEPDDEQTHKCAGVEWTATVQYQGARIFKSAPTVEQASLALAVRLLDGAACRCGKQVTLGEQAGKSRCRWRLEGDQWVPGCDADPITIAKRGDYDAIMAAYSGGNRAQRRAAKRMNRRNSLGY